MFIFIIPCGITDKQSVVLKICFQKRKIKNICIFSKKHMNFNQKTYVFERKNICFFYLGSQNNVL